MKPLAVTCPDCDGHLKLFSDHLLSIELKFVCPECHQKLRVDAQAADRAVNCPLCRKPIKVPMFQVGKKTESEARETEFAESPSEPPRAGPSLSLEEIAFLTESNAGNDPGAVFPEDPLAEE